MTCSRLVRSVLTLGLALGSLSACGSASSTSSYSAAAARSLQADLKSVDQAVVAGNDAQAAAALALLTNDANRAVGDGQLSSARAASILGAANRLRADLAATTTTTTVPATTTTSTTTTSTTTAPPPTAPPPPAHHHHGKPGGG
jgi:hypothetical protein